MASQVCWGVELGAGALKAVKLERTGDGVAVTDFLHLPHKRVLSTPEINEPEARRLALGALVSQKDLRGASVAISVAGNAAFARFAKLPPVTPKQIPDIVKFEAVQQIPFPIDEVEWDYQTFASPDSPDVEVGIFAIRREQVLEKLAMWQDVALTPDVLTLSPLAVYNAIAFDQAFTEKTPGTVLLDIGTLSTDLIVAEGGRVWIRTFPIGGHQFTDALVAAFNLSYSKAEKLKREAEQTQHTRHVLQAMRPIFGDLAQDVQRSIGYYESTHPGAKLTRLVGLGATFNLPGLRKFLSQQLSIEVVRQEGWSRLKVEAGAAAAERDAEFQRHGVEMATAVGCALQGLGYETIGANLMPVSIVREAMWKRKTAWFVTAAGVAVAAGALAFLGPLRDRAAIAATPRPPEIDRIKSQAQQLKSQWGAAEGEYQPDKRAPGVLTLLSRRDVHAHITNDLGLMMANATSKLPPVAPAAATAGAPAPAAGSSGATPARATLQFRQFRANYLGAGGLAADPFAAGGDDQSGRGPAWGGQSGGGSGFGGVGGGGGGAGGGLGGDPTAFDPNNQRVRVSLDIATTMSVAEADRFVNQALQQWLYDHLQREGVPYEIVKDSVRWRGVGREQIADASPAAPSGDGGSVPAVTPPGTAPSFGGGGNAPPRPAAPIAPGGAGNNPFGGGRMLGGGGDRGMGAPLGGGGGNPADDLARLAPLPPAEPLGPPGSTVLVYRVEWELKLKPAEGSAPASPEGGQ